MRQLESAVPQQQQQAARSILLAACESQQSKDAICAAGAVP